MKTIVKYGMLFLAVLTWAACEKKTDADGVISPITNVENVRKLYKGADVQLNTTILNGARSIVGLVISDHQKGNVPSGLVIMQSARTSNIRGINLDLGSAAANFLPGDSIVVNIDGTLLTKQNGAMMIKNLSANKITKVSSGNNPTVQAVSIADLNSAPNVYESTLVQINGVAFAQPYGQPFSGDKAFSDSGAANMFLHTEATATFAAESLPKTANATGIAVVADNGSGVEVKLWPQSFEAVANTEVIIDPSTLVGKTPIIITGYIANPNGTDGNYEYVQLMATEDIDFAVTNYALITYYGTVSGTYPASGWATGGVQNYKFNLTSGTVRKGEFFYVGGSGKTINGSGSTDIASANWIRSIAYVSVAGDGGVGIKTAGLFTNSGNANGIAVFKGTTVTESTIPTDVVFFGELTGMYYQAGPPELGYRICDNDLYEIDNGEFFGKNFSSAAFAHASSTADSRFSKLGGVYNATTETWKTKRSLTVVSLSTTSQLTAIETGTGTTRIE